MRANEMRVLLDDLIGLDFNRYWHYYCTAYDVLRPELAKILGVEKDDLYNFVKHTDDARTHIIEFTYKGHPWFRLTGKKKKGETHIKWYGDAYHDWTIKDIEVYIYSYTNDGVKIEDRTLEDAIPHIDALAAIRANKKDNIEKVCIDVIKYIKSEYPDVEVSDLITTLFMNKLSLIKKVSEEK